MLRVSELHITHTQSDTHRCLSMETGLVQPEMICEAERRQDL